MSQPGEVASAYSGQRSLVVGGDWLRSMLQFIMIALSTRIRIEGCEGAPLLRWLEVLTTMWRKERPVGPERKRLPVTVSLGSHNARSTGQRIVIH